MVNPFAVLMTWQIRLLYQCLDMTQQVFRTVGLWGQMPGSTTTTPPPVIIKAFPAGKRSCVGAADLRG
jgi:hypothetical protein